MKLALAGDDDPRPQYSPWFSLQNIMFTYEGIKNWEIYAGVKNLLDWTPAKNLPFLISRAEDPFDNRGVPNPHGLEFSPDYIYAPNQGIRGMLGFRFKF